MPQKKIFLFDVDGTLTESRKLISTKMRDFLFNEVMPKVDVALVGGSDLKKIAEQMGGDEVVSKIKYVFSENGLVAHNFGKEYKRKTIQEQVGEEKLQKFINFALGYMSKLTLPVKRGTFIEFRTGLINVCPVGRSCSQKERDEFEQYDKIHKIREKFIEELKREFPDIGLIYSIGGQISFDVFPKGWDKTYCLNHIETNDYDEIHFFGDKTDPGGNDHELYNHSLVIGHNVTSP
ncbi:UNVERIFIED_CONTAM: hypothetical protein PYX00_001040 [Menopon gallinae]|uniref:Phosphomannomutase n=1 Tax=Menopon gallinae TaxID=328185 RepID=A0AAW2ICR4_9NEOP